MMQRASLVRGGVTLNPPLPGAHRQKFLVGRWLPFLAPSWQIQKGPRQPGQAGDLLMHEVSGPRGSTPSGLSMGFSIFAELVVEIMTPLKMW